MNEPEKLKQLNDYLFGLRSFDLNVCRIPEDIYYMALGRENYISKCKSVGIKPSPFTLSLKQVCI